MSTNYSNMKSEDSIYNITVQLPGISSVAEIGRFAARGFRASKMSREKNMIMKCYADMNFVFLKVL